VQALANNISQIQALVNTIYAKISANFSIKSRKSDKRADRDRKIGHYLAWQFIPLIRARAAGRDY
jgi:hypothetical protein